tara:strand:+ start:36 stop:209 length:174 start_codon:yes stop_codon:yes gene_type:complete
MGLLKIKNVIMGLLKIKNQNTKYKNIKIIEYNTKSYYTKLMEYIYIINPFSYKLYHY